MLLDEKNKKNITNREHDCLFEDVLLGPSWSEGIALQEQFIKQCDEDVAMIFKEDKDPDLSTILNAKNTLKKMSKNLRRQKIDARILHL